MTNASLDVSSRTHKKSRKGGYDYLSNLHESILSQVLSRLSLEEAVRTSSLSKEWKFKWTCISDVIIDDANYEYDRSEAKKKILANFVDRVLQLTHNLRSFRFTTSNNCGLSQLTRWISTVLDQEIDIFEIIYRGPALCNNDYDLVYTTPVCVHNFTSLHILKLELPCTFTFGDVKSCTFPNLKRLYFKKVQILNRNFKEDSTLSLIFPVLEKFVTLWCKWANVKSVEIHAPELTSFCSHTCGTESKDYSMKIFAPKLVEFDTLDTSPENIILHTGGSHVVSASLQKFNGLNHVELIAPQVAKLLNGFSNLEHLTMSTFMVEAFQSGGFPSRGYYNKLRRLELIGPLKPELVFEFLHRAPRLKFLRIDMAEWENYKYKEMESVPPCILSHLEEVETWGFGSSNWSHKKFIKFLLRNGEELKKVLFMSSYKNSQRELIFKDISKSRKRRMGDLTVSFHATQTTVVINNFYSNKEKA